MYRWGAIARRLWHARNFQPLALSANIGYRFYAHNLHKFYTCDWPVQTLPQLPTISLPTPRPPKGPTTVCG